MYKAKTIVSTSKRSLDALPFDALGEQCQLDKKRANNIVENFALTLGLKKQSWVYPQLLAEIGKWALVKTTEGQVDTKATLAKNLSGNLRNVGYYFFAMCNTRFVMKQYEGDNLYYCAMVPLIMAAFKKFQNIKYSQWTDLEWVMPENLYLAVSADVPDYSLDYLRECRKNGIKEGGKSHNSYGIYHLTGPGIDKAGNECAGLQTLPTLAKMILCQTWCAHPNNRNEYMILNLSDFDNMPEPLVDGEVFNKGPTSEDKAFPWTVKAEPKPVFAVEDLPWDA